MERDDLEMILFTLHPLRAESVVERPSPWRAEGGLRGSVKNCCGKLVAETKVSRRYKTRDELEQSAEDDGAYCGLWSRTCPVWDAVCTMDTERPKRRAHTECTWVGTTVAAESREERDHGVLLLRAVTLVCALTEEHENGPRQQTQRRRSRAATTTKSPPTTFVKLHD